MESLTADASNNWVLLFEDQVMPECSGRILCHKCAWEHASSPIVCKFKLCSFNKLSWNIFVALKGTNSGLFADFCTNSSGIPMGVIFSKSKKCKNLPQNKNPGPNNPNSIFCQAIYV
jgi:hypothetical protein